VLSHGLDSEGADHPNGAAEKKNDADRAQPSRIERFLGQAGLDKAGDVYLLTVGIHARPVERL
jgi:hypothetical protein